MGSIIKSLSEERSFSMGERAIILMNVMVDICFERSSVS